MLSTLSIAVIAGLGGMLGWGLADLFAKKTIDEIGDVATLFLAHLFGAAALVAVLVTRWAGRPPTLGAPLLWIELAGLGILQATVYLLVYRGFGKGQVALLNPLFSSFSGLTALLSIMMFGETVSGSLALALAITFLGVLLLNADLGALRQARFRFRGIAGFSEVAGATLLAAVWTILWDRVVHGRDWATDAALMYIFMTLAIAAYVVARRIRLSITRRATWLYLALIGLCEAIAYLSISWGYGTTPHASVVALLSGAFSLPSILLARVLLREQTTRLQLAASLVIVAGIALVNVG